MIDPNELMTGNKVIIDGEYMEVLSIDADRKGKITVLSFNPFGLQYSYHDPTDINPISLSIEVLDACGFQKSYGDEWCNEQLESGFIISEFSDGYAMSEPCKKGIGNKYLHQLQNLYFIITGQQLEIDLTKLKTALDGE